MSETTRITIAGHPNLNVRVKLKPIEFAVGGEASVTVATGEIQAEIGEVPYSIFVPFLGRRLVSSLGPFCVNVRPLEAQMRVHGVNLSGLIGGKEAGAEIHAQCEYKAEIDIEGEAIERCVAAVIAKAVEE